ncbi:MAG: hypothetical protein WCD53_00230 [Microcoleus sp.]
MNRVKQTTVNLTPSVVEVSECREQLRSPANSELLATITEAKAVTEYAWNDRPSAPSVASTRAAPRALHGVDSKAPGRRSPVVSSTFLKWLLERLSRSKSWVAVVTVTAVWGWWNGQLLSSTGVGIGVMLLVYRAGSWNWQLVRSKGEQFWEGPNRRLVLAVASGGIATLGTYMSFAIWADSQSLWMAVSAIWQYVGTIALVALLLRQALNQRTSKDEAVLDRILADLTDSDPVKRLIAVRQITNLVNNPGFGPESSLKSSIATSHAAECFRLMLSREPEALVRNALVESLQALDTL